PALHYSRSTEWRRSHPRCQPARDRGLRTTSNAVHLWGVVMIAHVVLLRPNPGTSQETIADALQHVKELRDSIRGIVAVEAGHNLSNWHHGYSHGFIMHCTDAEHLQAYAGHEAHKPVSDELQRLCESIIDFDLALGGAGG